jgi:integrase/recombinase XerD
MKLSEGIDGYLVQKRAGGFLFNHGEACFLEFCRRVGDVELSRLTTDDIQRFLDEPSTSTHTWRGKYQLLAQFFAFWSSRRMAPELLMPPPKPAVRQTFVPYIYTRAELRALLSATAQTQKPKCLIDSRTLRTFLLLLYATGSSVGEMLALKCNDVDIRAGTLTIRSRNPSRDRELPIGDDLQEVVRRYIRDRTRYAYASDYFFTTHKGRALSMSTVTQTFRRVRSAAGIIRRDSIAQQPRMQDLRVTFAVHRITSWIRNGANLNRMLPALAVYMGQVGLGATEKYLLMAPEHYRKQLNMLSPIRGRRRWRDDKELIAFLNAIQA